MYCYREMRLALATIIMMLTIMVAGAMGANVYYVDGNVGSSGGGSSWANAFETIKEGIDACNTGSSGGPDLVKVAGSTSGLTYEENIVLDSYITLEGGWDPGTDTRDPEAYESIIDGCAAGTVVMIDSKFGVRIDGFTIQNGSAGYYGGGIYCYYSSATITNNEITANSADNGGGIFCYYYSSAMITNNEIAGNSATYSGGGMRCYYYSSPTLINNEITGNSATYSGGGMHCYYYSSPTLTNCTIADNVASSGGGMYCNDYECEPELLNCILWGDSPDEIAGDTTNLTVTYSDVEGGWTGTGNIGKDPLFVPISDAPYYLAHTGAQAANSPCVDAGSGSVSDYGLEGTTTCTDGREDGEDGNDDGDPYTGPIDMGYHYPAKGYSGSGDTYIDLVSFTARPAGSSVVLDWETGAEIDNAGFVVYRAVAGTFDYEQISDLIAAEGAPASGASYSFIDRDVEPGVSYNYWLVDIDTSGKWTAHGPATARLSLRPVGPRGLHELCM